MLFDYYGIIPVGTWTVACRQATARIRIEQTRILTVNYGTYLNLPVQSTEYRIE